MKALRLYWIVKGNQELKIGDNIKIALDDMFDFDDYYICDWGTNFDVMFEDIYRHLQSKKRLNNGKDMINSNIYLCSGTGTIRAIIPINKRTNKEKQYEGICNKTI